MRKLFTLGLCVLLSVVAFAQQQTVTGTVTDAGDGAGVPGVSILVKGSSTGTRTDALGKYQISVPPNATLVYSFIGYATQEVPVGNQTVIDVKLAVASQKLEEVVVVGYGVQQKKDVTGAISSVKEGDIANRPLATADQALQGKAAGVLVTTGQGTPGTAPYVRVRGVGTTGNSNPLYVVDGMFVDDITYLNPSDIASMEVLKDASALAIYGVRGANGVILVTTKSGKAGKTAFSYQGYAGFTQAITRRVKLANAEQFGYLVNQVTQNSSATPIPQDSLPFPNPAALGQGTNWFDQIFQRGFIQSHQISAAGGSDKSTYNLSLNYFSQQGIVKTNDYERYSLRFNNTYQTTSWLKLGNNVALTYSQSNNVPGGVIFNAYAADPTVQPVTSNGSFGFSTQNTVANPVAQLYYNNSKTDAARLVGNIFGEVNFLKNFTFRSSFGMDATLTKNTNYTPLYQVSANQRTNNSTLSKENDILTTWLWENTLTYSKTFGVHSLTALLGVTAQQSQLQQLLGTRTDVPGYNANVQYLSLGNPVNQAVTDVADPNNGPYVFSYLSNLFRVNYTLMDRYLLTVSVRRDGSSRFPSNNRYSVFPAVGIGWRLSEEDFIKQLNIFDNLKLRASYGKLGNTNIPNYQYYAQVANNLPGVFGQGQSPQTGATEVQPYATGLTWEVVNQTDIGLEAGFLNNRLTFEADYYHRATSDVIVPVRLPNVQASVQQNAGNVLNKGFEFTAGWNQQEGDFKYSINANLTTITNRVTNLGNGGIPIIGGGLGNGLNATLTNVGYPIGAFWGYQVAGIFQSKEQVANSPTQPGAQPGDLIFVDTNRDGKIDDNDRTYLGSPIPKVFWGLNTNFSYKNFDLTIDVQGSEGNKIYNAKEAVRFGNQNFQTDFLNAWTPSNPSNTWPRLTNGGPNYNVSSFFVQSGNFVRIRTIQLGYNVPKALLEKAKVKSLRIYLNALNPITITKYQGFSPEVGGGDALSRGVDINLIPTYSTFTGGVNLGF